MAFCFCWERQRKPGNTKATSVNRLSSLLFRFRIFQILDFVHFYKNEPQGKRKSQSDPELFVE